MSNVTLRAHGLRYKCVITESDSHIIFNRAPFEFKEEIKAMQGARWFPESYHWRVKNSPRNKFQLAAMMVEPENPNPYAWFEQTTHTHTGHENSPFPLRQHQIDMVQKVMTLRYQILAAHMGLGKTLTSIEIMRQFAELYGWDNQDFDKHVWFVGPKSALESVEADLYKWKVDFKPRLLTYGRLVLDGDKYIEQFGVPQLVFFDESSSLKSPGAQRTQAAQSLADKVREEYGMNIGGVVLLSGTPTAKRPSDIWSQAEIAWPGFLREGSFSAFEDRYAVVVTVEDADGTTYKKIEGWRDEEVEKIPSRLDGLMSVYRKDDLLNLPERTFTRIECPSNARTNRVARILADSAPNVITALTRLRALSSGFQYTDDESLNEAGERAMVETACPKDDILRQYLTREETRGRMIAFASFQGSLDRVKRICQAEGWDTIMVDGRGWNCFSADGEQVKQHILDFWADNPNKTVFIGNPASCRFGLTLVEAKTTVVFDQNFSAEHRLQSLDRNYRIGQDEPVEVVDLLHLPVDGLIVDTLTENKRLEELSLGLIVSQLGEVTDGSSIEAV